MTGRANSIAEIYAILTAVAHKLPGENVTDARELLDHDEWGEALSLICTQIYEYEVAIDLRLFERIQRIGKQIELSPSEWELLRELVV